MKQQRFLFLVYLFVTVTDLLLIYFKQDSLRWFTKPLLMPLLITVVYINKNKIPLYSWMIAGLSFSWAGDILLQLKDLFLPGLASFLLAHICYIIYFIQIRKQTKGLLQQQPLMGLPVLIYIVIFLWLLYPFLDVLTTPVTIYGITIGTMLLMSINTKKKINDQAAALFFHGALQFVISDSILAINLFVYTSMVLSLCVMVTYASAQYLLVKGSSTITSIQ